MVATDIRSVPASRQSHTAPASGTAATGDASIISPERRRALLSARLPVPVALYLLAVVLPIGFNAGPLALTTLRVLLLIFVLPLLVQLFRGRFGKIIFTDILFILHVCWATAALGVNNPSQVVEQIGSVGVEFLGGYLIGRAYIRSIEDFVALCRWLVILVCISMPFAVFEALTGRPLIVEIVRKLPGLTSVGIVSIEKRMGLERVQLSFAHPIHYGLFCSVAFSLGFVAMKGVTSSGKRWVTSVLITCSGFLALSSGALLAIVLQVGLILWSTVFKKIRWRWWLLVALFAVAYVVIDLLSNRTPVSVFMSYATFSAHNAYWRGIIFEWGMKSVWAHQLFGIGLNDWVRPSFMFSGSMDNFWLVMAVRYGIPGFALLVAGYVLVIFRVMRRNFERDLMLTQIRRAWVFTFLGLSFTLSTVHIWTNIYSFVLFMFGTGVWLITAAAGSPEVGAADPEGHRPVEPARAAPSRASPLAGPERPAAVSGARSSPHTRFQTAHVRGTPSRPSD